MGLVPHPLHINDQRSERVPKIAVLGGTYHVRTRYVQLRIDAKCLQDPIL